MRYTLAFFARMPSHRLCLSPHCVFADHIASSFVSYPRVHVWDITRPHLPVGTFDSGSKCAVADLLWFGNHGNAPGLGTPTPASTAAREAAFLDQPPLHAFSTDAAPPQEQEQRRVFSDHEEHRGDSDDVDSPPLEGEQRALWLTPGGGHILEREGRLGGASPSRSPLALPSAPASSAMDSREEMQQDLSLGQAAGWPAAQHRSRGGAPARVARVMGGTPDRARAPVGSRRRASMHARSRTTATSNFLGYGGAASVADGVTLHDTTSDEDEGVQGGVQSAPGSPAMTGRVSKGASITKATAFAATAASASESRANEAGGVGSVERGGLTAHTQLAGTGPPLEQPSYSYELNTVRAQRPLLAVFDDGQLVMHVSAAAYQPHRAVSTCSIAVGPTGVAWISNATHRASAWPLPPPAMQDRAFPPTAPVKPRNALTIFKPHASLDGRILPSQSPSSAPAASQGHQQRSLGGSHAHSGSSAFSTLALAYRVQGLGGSIVKLCLHNALVAQAVGAAAGDMAAAWSVLAVLHVDVDAACGPSIRTWFNSYASGVMAERARERKRQGASAPGEGAAAGAAAGGGGTPGGPPTLGLDSALLALGASLAEVVASLESDAGMSAELTAVTGVGSPIGEDGSESAASAELAGPATSSSSVFMLGPLAPKGETFELSATSVWLHSVRQAFVRRLFDFHALRGDVQTCVTVARVLLLAAPAYQTQLAANKPDYKVHNMNVLPDVGVGFERLARWEERYVTLLHSLRLWSPASTIMACSSHPTIQSLNINRTAVLLARGGKKSKMALPSTHRPEAVMRSSMHPILVPGKRLWMQRRKHAVESRSKQPSGLVLAHGSLSGFAVRNFQQAAAVCAVCCMPVMGLYTQCNFCGVGGHTQCLKRWFDSHTHAPGSGGHACVRPEQSLSHSDHVRADDDALWPAEDSGIHDANSTSSVPHTSHGFELLL